MINAILSVVVLILTLVYFDRKRRQRVLKECNIPGPEARFFDGNFFKLMKNQNVLTVSEWYKKYGRVFGYYIGSRPRVVVSDLNLLRKILVKDFHLFSSRSGFVRGGLQADESHEVSLISLPLTHQRWKEQRSMLTTAFTSMKMKQTVPLIHDAIDATIERLEKHAVDDVMEGEERDVMEGEERDGMKKDLDLYAVFQGLTLDTIGRAAFGVETNVQRDPENDSFLKAARRVFEGHLTSIVYLPLMLNFLFDEFDFILFRIRQVQWFLMRLFGYRDHVHLLRSVVSQVIEERRSLSSKHFDRKDLLQTMLDANVAKDKSINLNSLTATSDDTVDEKSGAIDGNGNSNGNGETTVSTKKSTSGHHHMTDEEIGANSLLFFEAGYETTSTLLGYVTFVLIKYPAIQERIRDEVNEMYQRDGDINYNVITSLPYLDAVLNETMRMYPPVTFFVSRTASVDYTFTIPDGKSGEMVTMTIPKNSGVQVPVYQLHHDPEFWTNPELFDPERFLPGNASHDPMSFQPFGSGPRNCIGMRFALLEAKMALARVLRLFKLEPGTGTDVHKDIEVDYKPITMTPKNGINVRVVRIKS